MTSWNLEWRKLVDPNGADILIPQATLPFDSGVWLSLFSKTLLWVEPKLPSLGLCLIHSLLVLSLVDTISQLSASLHQEHSLIFTWILNLNVILGKLGLDYHLFCDLNDSLKYVLVQRLKKKKSLVWAMFQNQRPLDKNKNTNNCMDAHIRHLLP